MRTEILVVGAGFAGSVVAQRLARSGRKVVVMDRRSHIGGNAYDEYDAHGVLIHRYGPHIFHTNSDRIFSYLSRFTAWRDYEHKVLAKVGELLLPIPINQDTVNRLYKLELDEEGMRAFLERSREPRDPILTSEDVVLNSVGRDLCDKFFRGYTRKQWGLDLSQLSAGVASRIPVRTNRDDRYFTDTYQAMPAEGYTKLFSNLLDDSNIKVELDTDFLRIRDRVKARRVVYTGPVDAYFGSCFGELPYRSLRFEHEHRVAAAPFQPTGTVNFPNDYEYTRITEFKYLTGQVHAGTSIVREYPQALGDPYYPIPRPENERLYRQYRELVRRESHVFFLGRLAQYRYYNMDQVVGTALKGAEEVLDSLDG